MQQIIFQIHINYRTVSAVQIIMDAILSWSNKQFGDGRSPIPILHHLKKEVPELIESLNYFENVRYDESIGTGEYSRICKNVNMEFADCMMLILDAAAHHGITATQLFDAVKEKLEINKNRMWDKPDENGVCEHVR